MGNRFAPVRFDRAVVLRASLLSGIVVGQAATIAIVQGSHSARTVLPFWIASLVCATLLFTRRSDWSAIRSLRLPRLDLAIVTALTVLAAALRLPNLERLPSGIHGDEGEFATVGLAIANGDGPPLFGVAFLDDPAAYPHLLAAFINVFGADMAAVRLPSALFGIATISILYALVQMLAGRIPASLATFLLATSAVHIHFSRLAINVIEVPFFACLSLLLLVAGIQRRRFVFIFLSGVAGGMVVYFHFGGRLLPLILALALMSQLLVERTGIRRSLQMIGTAALGGLLALSPLLAHLANRPELLTGHVAGRGIWNYWDTLAEQYSTTPSNRVGILWQQFRTTLSAFTTEPDPFRGAQFFRFMDAPLLTAPIAALALIGLVILCLNPCRLANSIIIIWFVAPVILASTLTDTAGQAHRLINPLLPAIIAAVLLIDRFIRVAQRHAPQRAANAVAVALVVVVLACGSWDGSRYAEPWITDRISPAHTAQARCLEALPYGTVALVAGAPFIRADHGPSRYLGNHIDRSDLEGAIPSDLNTNQNPVIIVIHEWEIQRLTELLELYPSAEVVEIERPPGTRAITVAGLPNDGFDINAILNACRHNAASDPE